MFYRRGWTQREYDEAREDRISYTVARDLMLVPEVMLTPGMKVFHSPSKGVVWVERATVHSDDIVPLTKDQVQQLIDESYIEKQ